MNDPFFQIEPIERAEGEIRNGFVALVQNHHRTDHPQGVAQRILDHRKDAVIGGEVWRGVYRSSVAS